MADVNANIGVHINTSAALAELKALQRQLATFHGSISKGSAASSMAQKSFQTNLLNSINATGKFTAQMGTIRTSTESFTHALEKNKLTMREYYRFSGASTKTFGRLFKQEFDTINKVSEERVKKMQTQYVKMGRDASGAMKAMSIMPTTLNMKDYGTQTAMAAQRQALFNQLIRQGSTNLLNFGKNTQWAGRQLMVGFTIPLALLGTTAAKTFMALEEQTVRFRKVYGDMFNTEAETEKALEDIRRLAKEFTKYGIQAEKTIEVAARAAQTGLTGPALQAQVLQATRLSVLGDMDQEKALEATIALQNAFKVSTDKLAESINFLNAVENQTVLSLDDIVEAVPRVGPIITELGGDVKDLAFFLTAMKEGGVSAAQGANALKSGLGRLINPTRAASEYLADLGINITGIIESNTGDLRATVMEFATSIQSLDDLTKARAVEKVFGKFQFARALALLNNITKEGSQASRALDLTGASIEQLAIIAERELKVIEDSIGVNFKEAIQQLKLALEPIGKEFIKVVTPLVEVVGDLLKKFNNLSDGTKKFIVIGTALVGLIGPVLLMTLGLLANGVANIIKLFLSLRIGFLKLTGNSKILAEQTNYLNIEQLESATVAASLNQAHTTLTQSFTAEAAAVRALRQAYIDATVAAANFARANPGMMMPRARGIRPGTNNLGQKPKKMNSGGMVLGAGTATSDSIPAYLSNGEYVIKADAVDQYGAEFFDKLNAQKLAKGGLINLPGYFDVFKDKVKTDLFENLKLSPKEIKEKRRKETDKYLKNFVSKIKDSLGFAKGGLINLPGYFDEFKDKVKTDLFENLKLSPKEIKEKRRKETDKYLKNFVSKIKDSLGFADGIVSVPGPKGAGDIIPAMLSPGEAVIPSQVAQNPKIKPIISAMVNGKLQGFNGGTDNVQPFANSPQFKGKVDYSGPSQSALRSNPDQINDLLEVNKRTRETDAEFAARSEKALAQRQASRARRLGATLGSVPGTFNFQGVTYKATSPKTAASMVEKINAELIQSKNPGGVGEDKASKTIANRMDDLQKRGKGLSIGTVFKHISGGKSVSGGAKANNPEIAKLRKQINAQTAGATLNRETARLQVALQSAGLTLEQQKDFLKVHESHILKPTGTKGYADPRKWQAGQVVSEFEGLNNYLNRAGEAKIKRLISSVLLDSAKQQQLGYTSKQMRQLSYDQAFAATQKHPTTAKELQSISRIAKFEVDMHEKGLAKIDKIHQARGIGALTSVREPAFYKKFYSRAIQLGSKDGVPTAGRVKRGQLDGLSASERRTIARTGLGLITVGKGETLRTADGKDRKVTGQTGVAKPSNVRTRNTSDRRIVPTRGLSSVLPKGRGRLGFMAGANDGYSTQTGASIGSLAESKNLKQSQVQAALEKTSRKEAKRRIAAETKLGTALENQAKETTANNKKKIEFGKKLTGGLNALSGLSIAASFAGGQIGEMAQKILPFVILLSTISMLAPSLKSGFIKLGALLLANPLFAAFAAIGVIVAGMKIIDARNKKQAQAQSNYIDAISATTEKMKKAGQLTGKVGASEIMARRREGGSDKFTTDFERAGQQFGATFLDSELGKSIYDTFRTNLENGGKDAVKNIALELSAYVSDGVISAEQANSIARSIGINLSNSTIGANIQGQLRQVLGPDGQDLANNPLKVRLEIVEGQRNSFEDVLDALTKDPKFKFDETMASSLSALGVQSLEISQAQRDAQTKLYDDQLRGLQSQLLATTDKKKQVELEQKLSELKAKQASDDAAFATQRKSIITDQIRGFEATSKYAGINKAFFDSLDQQVTNKFKDDPFLSAFFGASGNTKLTELQVSIKTLVGSGALTPKASIDLLEMFGKGGEKELNTLLKTTFVTQDPGKVQELVNIATSLNNKEIGVKLVTDISAPGGEAKFEDRLSALALLQKLDGKEINLGVFLKENAVGKLDTLVKQFNKIEKIKTPITKSVLQEFINLNPDVSIQGFIDDYEKYANLPDEVKKTAIQSFITIRKTITDENVGDMAKDEAKSRGLRGPAAAEFIKNYSNPDKLAQILNRELYPDTTAPFSTKKTNGGGEGGKRDTTFDDILANLKRTRDATIDVTKGANELMRILGGKKDLQFFKGLDQQLSKLGANSDFIDFVGGIEKAVQTKLIKVNKAGIASLTELGKATKKAYDEKQLGSFSSKSAILIKQLQGQRKGFVALKAAGASSADALEMVEDADFAVSLSKAKTTEEVKELIKQFQNERKEIEKTLRATDPLAFLKTQTDIIDQKLDLDERIARRTYEKETKAAEDQIDANNKIIEQAERILEVDEEIGNRKIENINNEIEGLQRRISIEVDAQQDILDSESRILSEDQAIISNTVDLINKKYDEQEKALSKIYEINEDIAEQEKQKLGLADAITQGDISAAAQAAQEITARNAARSGALAQEMLGRAREAEIAGVRGGATGKTADEIAARQYQIERQGFALSTQRLDLENKIKIKQEELYQIELKRQNIYTLIRTTQDNSYAQNQIIAKAQEALDIELNIIDVQKNRLKDLGIGIDAARLEGVKFTKELEAAFKVLQDMSNLFSDSKEKGLKVTEKQIEDKIKDSAIGRTTAQSSVAAIAPAIAAATGVAQAKIEADNQKKILSLSEKDLQTFNKIVSSGLNTPWRELEEASNPIMIYPQIEEYRASGGLIPKYFASGALARGTDTIPAMLTPGEFVIRKNAVDNFGANNLNKINNGMSPSNSVYNYNVSIDVNKSNASSDDIARSVIGQIKYIDSQRIKGQR